MSSITYHLLSITCLSSVCHLSVISHLSSIKYHLSNQSLSNISYLSSMHHLSLINHLSSIIYLSSITYHLLIYLSSMSHLSIYICHPSLPAPGLSSGTRDHHHVRLAHRLSSWGVKAWLLRDTWTLGSLTRNHTPIPCIARQTLDC